MSIEFDTKYLQKLVELNEEMKTAFGKENLTENIEEAIFQFAQFKNMMAVETFLTIENEKTDDEGNPMLISTLTIPAPKETEGSGEPVLIKNLCYGRVWIAKFIVSDGWIHLGINTWRGCNPDTTIELPMSIKKIPVSSSSPFHGLTDLTLIVPDGFAPTTAIDLRYQTSWNETKVRSLFDKLGTTESTFTISLDSNVYDIVSEETKAIATNKGWTVSSV